MTLALRPYQARAHAWTLTTWASLRAAGRPPSVVLQSPTGSGKSAMADALDPDLVICPGTDLADDLRRRVRAPVRHVEGLRADLRGGRALPRAERVVVDEARWACSAGNAPIVEHYLAAGCEVAMFDATPTTASGQGLGRWAGALLQVASMRDLIEGGYLVPFRVLAPVAPQEELADTPYGAWSKATPGESCIVFAENKAHAARWAAEFEAWGARAAVITDDTPRHARKEAIAALASGETKVAVCAQILRQGIDVPRVSSIILARAVDSYPLYMQAVGRGSRPHLESGKRGCTVLDLRGASHAHGLPDDDVVWRLDGAPVKLLDSLPPASQCRACLAWGRGGLCAYCHAALPPPPPPRIRAADLIEMRAGEDVAKKRATCERYVGEALDKGHNPWAAKHRYRGTYGEYPPPSWITQAVSARKDWREHAGQ